MTCALSHGATHRQRVPGVGLQSYSRRSALSMKNTNSGVRMSKRCEGRNLYAKSRIHSDAAGA